MCKTVVFSRFYFLFFTLGFIEMASAQSFTFSGKVVNQDKRAMPFITVSLLKNESEIGAKVITDSLGVFSMNAERGTYVLHIEQLGVRIFDQTVLLEADTDVGIIAVKESELLNEVVINLDKKLIERKSDRLVFNVGNSIIVQGGSALDVLKVTPLLMVQSEQVSMIGKGAVGIMINDRFIALSGDDLTNYLKSLRSEDIESIEVITAPSAKYDAAGNSGIINIILKKNKSDSIYGSVQSSLSQANSSLVNYGFNLNYQKKRWTLTSSLGYVNGITEPNRKSDLDFPELNWEESFESRRYQNSITARFAADYRVTERSQMGAQYFVSFGKPLSKGSNMARITNKYTTIVDSIVKTESRASRTKRNQNANWYFQTKLDTIGRKISVDIDYLRQDTSLDYGFGTQTFLVADGARNPLNFFASNTEGEDSIDILTAKIDFEYPLSWVNFSFGGKLSFIETNASNNFFDLTTFSPIWNQVKSNAFQYRESIQALYVSASKKWNEKWSAQFGLRTENTQTKAFSITVDQRNRNSYWEWFPSLYVNYNFREQSFVSFTYNRRFDRPNYGFLNPFRFYNNATNYVEGNPFLQPYFTHNFELGAFHKNYYTSLYFNKVENGVAQINFIDPDRHIQAMTSENYYRQINYGWVNIYNFKKSMWENVTYLVFSYTKTASAISEIVPNVSSWNGHFNTRNSFILDSDRNYRLEINYLHRLPAVSQSYKMKGFSEFEAGFRMNIMDNKWQFAVAFADIFKTNKINYYQFVNGIRQAVQTYDDSHRIKFSLSYNFGKQFRMDTRKRSNEEEQKRL